MHLLPTASPHDQNAAWKRHNLITFVLAFACIILGLLAFEQDRTIQNQRTLINSLFHDSLELNAVKMQRAQEMQHR